MTHTAETLQKAFKYLFPDEVPALKQLARMLPSYPTVINIGAGAGTSGLAFMESRDDLHLITIDIQNDSSPFGCLEAELSIIKQAGFVYNDDNNLDNNRGWQVHGDSQRVGYYWQTVIVGGFPDSPPVDMVFIDGDHSYEGCKGDILAWLPNIKLGGIIAIHDYKKSELFKDNEDFHPDKPHPKNWPGVDRAVDELLLGKYEQILRVDSLIAFRV